MLIGYIIPIIGWLSLGSNTGDCIWADNVDTHFETCFVTWSLYRDDLPMKVLVIEPKGVLNQSLTSLSHFGFLDFRYSFDESLFFKSLEASVSNELTDGLFETGTFCDLLIRIAWASPYGYVDLVPWPFLLWRSVQVACLRWRSSLKSRFDSVRVERVTTPAPSFGVADVGC